MGSPNIDQILLQTPATDPATGQFTEATWWSLHSLRQGAQSALDNSFINSVELVPSGGVVTPDVALSGPLGSFEIVATGTVITVTSPINSKGTVPAGARLIIYYDQTNAGGAPPLQFSTGDGGFSPDLNSLVIIEDANARTTYVVAFDGVIWTLIAPLQTGQAL